MEGMEMKKDEDVNKIDLVICDITVEEAKEIMLKVREIEQKDPKRTVFTQIKGMENCSKEEVAEVMKKIFPVKTGVQYG